MKLNLKSLKNLSLESLQGKFDFSEVETKFILLFFYPKDSTPGCTLESQDFTKLLSKFEKKSVTVLGVSRDSLKSHQKFTDKFGLKVNLLSDPDETLCDIFQVIKEKNMYGKKVLGIERSTFLLDQNLNLIHEWRKVKADGHAHEVLKFVDDLEK